MIARHAGRDATCTGRAALAVLLLALAAVWAGQAEAADPAALGRKHAAKANRLASVGKCKLAVTEFSKAHRLLKDPVLLFNRAECQRKLGRAAAALADYRRFLAELPSAPNRASVEARIAALEGKTAPAEPARAPRTAIAGSPPAEAQPARTAAATSAAPASAVSRSLAPAAPAGPAPAAVPAAAVAPRNPAVGGERGAVFEEERLLPFAAPEPVSVEPSPSLPAQARPEVDKSRVSPWIWVGVAVLAAGAAAAAGLYLLDRSETRVPATPLGNHHF